MSTLVRRSRPLIATLLAASALLAISQPASASSCANADTPFTSGNSQAVQAHEAAILCLTNEKRAAHDLNPAQAGVQAPAPFVLDSRLANAARKHSQDMAARDYFSHTTPNGVTPWDRIMGEGYCSPWCAAMAENIAWRGGSGSWAPTARQVVDQWMASPGHRANILNPNLREIGVGAAYGTPSATYPAGGTYTQTFGSRG
jgi:uncharacterized protein YkwD